MKLTIALTISLLLSAPLAADPVVVEAVTAQKSGDSWRFSVTVSHPDTGWDHYADGWQVLAPDGTVLGTRVLAHPHVNEQPFTRSLAGVVIPEGITHVMVRARCNLDGYSGESVRFDLKP